MYLPKPENMYGDEFTQVTCWDFLQMLRHSMPALVSGCCSDNMFSGVWANNHIGQYVLCAWCKNCVVCPDVQLALGYLKGTDF